MEDSLTKTCLQCLPRERTGRIVHTEKPKKYCEDHNFWRGQQATMTVVFSSDPALDATLTVHGPRSTVGAMLLMQGTGLTLINNVNGSKSCSRHGTRDAC